MGNHWNIRIFLVYIKKHVFDSSEEPICKYNQLNINILNIISVSCKETDIEKTFKKYFLICGILYYSLLEYL